MTYSNLKLYFHLSILLLLSTLGLQAQRGRLFNANGQLSSSLVHQVYQDRQGFIWACTDNGLNRYDGYHFYVYNTADGLNNDNVNCVCQDRSDNLYIGTTSGLSVLRNNRIYPIYKVEGNNPTADSKEGNMLDAYITSFCTGPDGALYLGTSGRGIWKITGERQAKRVFENIDGILFAQKIAFDKKGVLWVVTNVNGVHAIKGRHARKYVIQETTNYADIAIDRHDNIYIGFINGGVYKADPSRRGFHLIPSTANVSVTSLMARKDNKLFVGTNGAGLKMLDTRTGELWNNQLHSNEVDLNKVKVYSISEDRTGNLWLGLMQKGVFVQPPHSNSIGYAGWNQGPLNPIGQACVMAVFRQRNGTLWVASDQDGLYALNADGTLKRHYAPDASSPKSVPSTVLTITEDYTGRLWIGSFINGCGWLDTTTGEYHRTAFSYGPSQSIFDMRMGWNNDLWIGTLGNGLKRLNLITGQMKEYKTNNSDPNDKNCINNDFILQMELDQEGRYLFVGTTTGLSCLDIKKGRWDNVMGTNRLLEKIAIPAVRYNRRTGLWAGNASGLYNIKFNHDRPNGCKVKHYTTADGLIDNHVASIEIDGRQRIWVSTSKGLCCLTPQTGKFVSYYESDGLQGNEYSEGASFRDAYGELYFGGTMGLSFFNPLKMIHRQQRQNVTLSQILVGGELIKAGDKSGSFEICDTAIMAAPRFDFSHQDNTITLRFSTLTYAGQKHISYRYSINNENWITLPPGQNELTLSRMPPGDYKFRVEALDNGVPSATKELMIVIHNPWYFTPIARIIYFLMVLAVIYWYMRSLKTRNRERLRLQEHIHAEELNEQKLRSFINLSHEIRTPMTLILTPLLQLMKEDTDSHRKTTYDIIRRNAERILHLVSQIMDIRKIDKGLMAMQMCETDFIDFVDDVMKMFQIQATSKHINMQFIHEGIEKLPVWIDRSQFDKVLINLMSNAMKYTPAGGDIKLSISLDKDTDSPQSQTDKGKVVFTIFDSGEKIPEQSLTRIFERFYQTSSASFQYKTGTGVGLDLTRSLVIMHHGEIIARNTEDGVEFVVTLPLGNEHLKPEEIAPWSEDEHSTETLRSELSTLEEDMQPEQHERQIVTNNGSRRTTVVIVEDDDEIRNYLMTELSTTYRTLSFPDGSEALPVIQREIPQLVISDVMMPNMDGNMLCSKIKSNVNTNHIPVILITAKTRDEDKLEGLETGADLYVTKPFNLDILRRNIANLIASRKVMQNKFTGNEDRSEQIDEIQIENADEKLLNRIMAVINDNLYNSDLKIDMICDEVGISRVHLHRKMKELTNQTPHDFIKNLRLKQAARLLSKKGSSVTDVMYRCGFSSSTSFSTMFRRMYGLTPRDYKREHEDTFSD